MTSLAVCYCFTSRILSLAWAIELVVEPGNLSARAGIVVSPNRRQIELDDLPEGKP